MTANASPLTPIQQRRARQRRNQTIVTVIALVILIVAWLIGRIEPEQDIAPYVRDVVPDTERVEVRGELLLAYGHDTDGEETLIGYAKTASAVGYGGTLRLLVGTDVDGNLLGTRILSHQETPNFFRQLEVRDYYQQFDSVNYTNPLIIGQDIDGVGGATLSAEAVAQSIRDAVRGIALETIPNVQLPPEQRPIKFGAPEVALLGLFAVSFFLHRIKNRRLQTVKNYGRWLVLLTGLIVLGFIFNKPLTLANIITFISGAWPDWQNNIYWFILLGGILFVTSVEGKNPYCSWFCPFGAAQEVLGKLSGAKAYQPRHLYSKLQWLQRSLSFTAIVLGLALRQPGAASYEPFGTLFHLEGSWPQWVLLMMVLFGSLIIYRPFCNYLCPLDPVVDYIGEIRKGVRNVWQARSKLISSTSKPQA